MDNDTVTIDREEYEELKSDSRFLDCLRAAGVDNWSGGYDYAMEMFHREDTE